MAERQSLNTSTTKAKSSKKKSKNEVHDENICPIKKKKPRISKKTSKSSENNVSGFLGKLKKTCQIQASNNILQYCRKNEMGWPCEQYKRSAKNSIINYCKTFELFKMESPFDRRVTFLVWHPVNPNLLAVTSHGGDLLLYNYEKEINASFIKGVGKGGSVQSMKFDPLNSHQLYGASMEGKFFILNFETKMQKSFLETNDLNRWYVSLDVNPKSNIMVAGDTNGSITTLTLDGQILAKFQIHKRTFKVSHTEYSKREPWLLCTSSTDKTIKFWDIRYIKQKVEDLAEPLQTINQSKPINAAYFSLTDGCRLLTTDQMDEIHIYRGPLWDLETIIHHPHRQYQHLTPIRAYWHPLEDIIFIGRYPCINFPGYHKNELRTIDFFDAETGELLYQHYQSGIDGIMSFNRFNITGDALASSYGPRFLIWKPNFKHVEKISKRIDHFEMKQKKLKNCKNDDDNDDEDDDDDDDDDSDSHSKLDWKAVMKTQAKEKRQNKLKEQKISKLV